MGAPIFVVPLVGVYLVASSLPRRQSVPLVTFGMLTVVLPGLAFQESDDGSGLLALVYIGWAAAAFLLGEGAMGRREYLSGLEERARYLECTRQRTGKAPKLHPDLHAVVSSFAHQPVKIRQSGCRVSQFLRFLRPHQAQRRP